MSTNKEEAIKKEKDLSNESIYHFHSQVLDKKSMLKAGRCWLSLGRKRQQAFRAEWYFGGFDCSVGFTIGNDEEDFACNLSFPCIGRFYFGWENGLLSKKVRNWFHKKALYHGLITDIRVFDWTIWFSWFNDDCGYSLGKKYKNSWYFDIKKFFLGDFQTKKEIISTGTLTVTMPENEYKGKYIIEEYTRIRRWYAPKHKFTRIDVDLGEGIPHPGKGTTSYNCVNTAMQGYSCVFTNFFDVKKQIKDEVLSMRKRYPL